MTHHHLYLKINIYLKWNFNLSFIACVVSLKVVTLKLYSMSFYYISFQFEKKACALLHHSFGYPFFSNSPLQQQGCTAQGNYLQHIYSFNLPSYNIFYGHYPSHFPPSKAITIYLIN